MKYIELESKYSFCPTISGAAGDGWVPVLDRMFHDLVALGWSHEIVPIMQIKEKFGQLRIYLDAPKPGIEQDRTLFQSVFHRVELASVEAETVCAWCGETGRMRGGAWIRVMCDDCDRKYLAGERR